jgi:hypothetical protein
MIAPIFQILKDDLAVTAFVGTNPCRIFPFGEAPQGTEYPYATYTLISAAPENYISNLPNVDDQVIQIDVWGKTAADVVNLAKAMRDALEPSCHMTNYGNYGRDLETKSYRATLSFEYFLDR